jgi:site-specific DNA-methyltransferase (adenine-specific)
MVSTVFYSSASDDWATPPALFAKLDAIFEFQLDACATRANAKCKRFFTRDKDGLRQDWHPFKRVWMNPPYGRGIEKWMEKAYRESLKGCIVVCLVFSKTDTRWWHDWVKDKGQVVFLKGRVRFYNPKHGPLKSGSPFPSCLVIYGLDFDFILNREMD